MRLSEVMRKGEGPADNHPYPPVEESTHSRRYAAALERFTYLAMHHKVAVDTTSRLVVIQPRTAHLAAELYVTAPWGVIHLDGKPWQKWGDPPEEALFDSLKYLSMQGHEFIMGVER